ncbi:TonB-dependent receptor [Hymenobacter siberiensis]|uniref:TonB-dependent receptor n=1 Tax=Hymenobacter siberiensis TaxID=2848396 RepID=UPI001D01AD12|nr:TonB-dependent receptor plug domain-containing protein [Hymenobacter siberiensis]
MSRNPRISFAIQTYGLTVHSRLVPIICLASTAAWGQAATTLTGQVKDAAGQPVIGASIVEKGTNNGTSTDANGRFTLRARTAVPRLIISSLGYTNQEVAGTSGLSVTLAENSTSLDAVQVVGSRSQNRSVTDSPSPVDIIDVREVTAKTGQLDVNQLLQFVAPSFNSNRQTGADGADHVDPASLRGLGPDQTLVLVNGKRWHQSALVNLFGSRGRGNTGTDLNTIPAASIERIEILRDGASAQYGSDAIAGVINIVLKTSVNELTANANYGAYTAKYRFDDKTFDGGNFNANLNYGVSVGKGGFVNATVDYNQRQHTQRANVLFYRFEGRSQFGRASTPSAPTCPPPTAFSAASTATRRPTTRRFTSTASSPLTRMSMRMRLAG